MTSNVSRLPGKFVWFEQVSNDVARAGAFYGPLFGWNIEGVPIGDQTYHMIHNGGTPIGGLRADEPGTPNHWISSMSVDNVDSSFERAIANGAKAFLPPTDFGGMGRGAGIADPTGARFYLWTSNTDDHPDLEKTPFGSWYWNELWTPDAKRALAFYESTFDYDHDTMSMGEQGDYFILKTSKPRGGIFQSPDDKIPARWLPYVHVEDCDASAAKATELGATVFMPATDIPGVGRFAAMFDPQGAAIAIIRGESA